MNTNRMKTCLAVGLGVVMVAGASGQSKGALSTVKVYESPAEIVLEAIDRGQAEGIMQGDIADNFKRQFNAKGRLWATASIVKSYKQKGCKRVKVVYVQHEAYAREGVTKVTANTEINYCLDGKAPASLE